MQFMQSGEVNSEEQRNDSLIDEAVYEAIRSEFSAGFQPANSWAIGVEVNIPAQNEDPAKYRYDVYFIREVDLLQELFDAGDLINFIIDSLDSPSYVVRHYQAFKITATAETV